LRQRYQIYLTKAVTHFCAVRPIEARGNLESQQLQEETMLYRSLIGLLAVAALAASAGNVQASENMR
jgi:hypothetical protein